MFSVPAPLITTLLFPRLARNGYLLVTFTLVLSSLCSYYLVMFIRFLSRRSLVRSSCDVFLFFPYCFFVLCHGFLRQICKRKGTNKVLLLLSRSPITFIVVSYDFSQKTSKTISSILLQLFLCLVTLLLHSFPLFVHEFALVVLQCHVLHFSFLRYVLFAVYFVLPVFYTVQLMLPNYILVWFSFLF